MSVKQTVLFAAILGVVAAGIVWWLEQFEVGRLHGEISDYLRKIDRFKEWEAEHGHD